MNADTELMKHVIWLVGHPRVEFFLFRALQSSEFPVTVLSDTAGTRTRVRDISTTIAGVITLARRAGYQAPRFNIDDFVGLLWMVHRESTAGPSTAMSKALEDLYDAMSGDNSRELSMYIFSVQDLCQNRCINTTLNEGDADLVSVLRVLNEPYFAGFVDHLKSQVPGAAPLGGEGRPADPEDCKAVLRPMFSQLGQILKKQQLLSESNIKILIENPPRSLPALMALQLDGWTGADKDSLWAPMARGLQQAKDHLQVMAAGISRSDTFQLDIDDILGELPTQKEAENDPRVLVVPAVVHPRATAVRGAGAAAVPSMPHGQSAQTRMAVQNATQHHGSGQPGAQEPQAPPTQHHATGTGTAQQHTQTHVHQSGAHQGAGVHEDAPVNVAPPKCKCPGGITDAKLRKANAGYWHYCCNLWMPREGGGCGYWKRQDAWVHELELLAAGRVIPTCWCSIPAALRTSNSEKNPGRRFYNCKNSYNNGCKYFQWLDEMH